jgi:uncharacterized protein YdaL
MTTLVLYDTTGPWGWLGEIYGIMAANLASHFGPWTAQPVVSYTGGSINQYTAAIYIGSTYGEPLPTAFLTDVLTTSVPVIWIYDNIWSLTAQSPNFTTKYGWNWSGFDTSAVASVQYKGQSLSRYAANGGGIMNYVTIGSGVTVLANAVRSDGTTFPWALRSGNLTYIGEIPFVYMTEGDRYLAFCDLLFDALAPATPTRHRALLRLEDIDPTYDPAVLKSIADYLFSQKVPFGFQVVPTYTDPLGAYNNGVPESTDLVSNPALVSALIYLQQKGGIMMSHGYTHQYSNVANPYTGVTGDDAEFYRLTLNTDGTVNYVGPIQGDSQSWAAGRIASAKAAFAAAGFPLPQFWTFPDYAGSVADYAAVKAAFPVRAERSLYFPGLLSGGTIDYTRLAGQYFPYTVLDIYGSKVLPDTLGGVEPLPFGPYPARLPAAVVADAQRNLVVRDGCASFFFHPTDSLSYLKTTVQGIKNLGYTFVSFTSM